MAINIHLLRPGSVLIFFLCLFVFCFITPNKCKIISLNNKYSQWQTLRSVETDRDGIIKLPSHNVVKRAAPTNSINVKKSLLSGTEKSNQAFVHWIGKETSEKIIVLTCQVNISSGVKTVLDSQLWRSDDYGDTFKKLTDEKFESQAKISYFYTFPTNNKKLLFKDVKAKKVYTTTDETKTFKVSSVPVEPDVVLPHPSDENNILVYSLSQRKLYASHDFANSWSLLSENVLANFYWGFDEYDDHNLVHMEIEGDSPDQAVYKACVSPKCTDIKYNMEYLGPFMADTLLVHKEFMFVQKSNVNDSSRNLMISYKRQPFQMANFPGNVKTNDFILLNLDDSQVFVAVVHDDKANLYLSDSTGHNFVLSFSDVYHVLHPYWLEMDLHEVQGMNWTYIVNKRVLNIPNGVQSYISFDKGGNWGPIPLTKELKQQCKDVDCYLQLNVKTSVLMTPAISSENAPGIIIAHGTLVPAKSKKPQPVSVFTSRDGGWTWVKAPFVGIHNLNILDQGSVLTAIPDALFSSNRTKTLYYSCNEGKTWKQDVFDDKGFTVNGVLTEPSILTLTELLFGHENVHTPWILMKLNFITVLKKKCAEEDYETWFPEDFNDVTQNNCTMGQLIAYKRRKQMVTCHNGEKLIPRLLSNDTCECTREDYECDFGYEEKGSTCSLSKWYYEGYLPVQCKPGETYMKSKGYRKVSADVCDEKETQTKYGKVKSQCQTVKPHGLSIMTPTPMTGVGQEVSFYLSQAGGSLPGTMYTWKLGDESPPMAFKGFEKARHQKYTFTKSGHFMVNVEAANEKGTARAELRMHIQDRLKDLRLVTPLKGKVGMPINIDVSASFQLRPFQDSSDHIHFLWTFGDETANARPFLTWDHNVTHTYKTKGIYAVSVEALTPVGGLFRQYQMQLFDNVEILVLTFEAAGIFNMTSPSVSRLLLRRLRYQLADDLALKLSRMETTSPGPNSVLLYIYPSDDPQDESIESIKKRVLDLVNSGDFGFGLLAKRAEGGVIIKVVSAAPYVIPVNPDDHHHHSHSGPNLKGVFIGVPVLILAVAFCIILLCYCRKKQRSAQQYNMLHMQDDSDALLDDEDDPPLDLNIEFRGRDNHRDDPVLDSGGSHLVMQDNVENC